MRVRTVMFGVGNVGRRLLEIMERKKVHLRDRYGLEFDMVAAGDSSGAKALRHGAEMHDLIGQKAQGHKIANIQTGGMGNQTIDPAELLRTIDADLLVELSPT